MNKRKFWMLSLTWGLLMTICGGAVSLFLRLRGFRSVRIGLCRYYEIGKTCWGGLNLGPVVLIQRDATDKLKRHEHGHAIQNCLFGPLILPLVLCSVVRYHDRNRRSRRGEALPDYDTWWFEGQATRMGIPYIARKEE